MSDPNCPRCSGGDPRCEECTTPRRGRDIPPINIPHPFSADDDRVDAIAFAFGNKFRRADLLRDLQGPPPVIHAFPGAGSSELRRLLEANREARAAALREPERAPEWLFRVFAVVDMPAGSGATWRPETRVIPGKNSAAVSVDVIAESSEAARRETGEIFKMAGHARWLVTKIQRMDDETITGRALAREALERVKVLD